MNDFEVIKLEPVMFPLVNKFYQAYNVRGRAKSHDKVWVVKVNSEIVAAAKITPKSDFDLLTGVFTAPDWRGNQFASKLVRHIIASQQETIYTFAYNHLVAWYLNLGFVPHQPTEDLASMFQAYCQQGRDICCLATNKVAA